MTTIQVGGAAGNARTSSPERRGHRGRLARWAGPWGQRLVCVVASWGHQTVSWTSSLSPSLLPSGVEKAVALSSPCDPSPCGTLLSRHLPAPRPDPEPPPCVGEGASSPPTPSLSPSVVPPRLHPTNPRAPPAACPQGRVPKGGSPNDPEAWGASPQAAVPTRLLLLLGKPFRVLPQPPGGGTAASLPSPGVCHPTLGSRAGAVGGLRVSAPGWFRSSLGTGFARPLRGQPAGSPSADTRLCLYKCLAPQPVGGRLPAEQAWGLVPGRFSSQEG